MTVRSLHVLHMGDIDCDPAIFLPGETGRITVPVPAYLLDTSAGWVLVDTGMHEIHVTEPEHTFDGEDAERIRPVMSRQHDVRAQLGRLGLLAGDVVTVINTHLHFDHAGQNHRFAHAELLVQREHYEAALADPGYPHECFALPQLHYRLLDGDGALMDGVEAIVSPGHAPALMALLVRLPDGPVLLCGDAIPLRAVLDRDEWGAFGDPLAARASALRLVAVAERESAPMLLGHDVEQWRRLPRAPEPLTAAAAALASGTSSAG